MLELQEGRAQFNKRERNKQKDERKDITDIGTVQKALQASPQRTVDSPSAPVTVNPGSLSMHSSNPKLRNSPSQNAHSPIPKQEVMVRPPTVMSPSGNPQLDSKFSSQGKQGTSTGQSIPSPCDGKGGNHTPKSLQTPSGSMGLKNGAGNGTKGKGKRERSISSDSFDQRDAGTPNTDSEIKDCNSTDTVMSQDSQQGPHSLTPSNVSMPRSSTPSHAQTMGPESATVQKVQSKVVYVFSTEMANKAAEAVLRGQAESIVLFHIQSTSNSKAERSAASMNLQSSTVRSDPKTQLQSPSSQEQNQSPTIKQQSNTPVPEPASKTTDSHCPPGQDAVAIESKISRSPANAPLLQTEGSSQSSPNNQASSPIPQGSGAPSIDSKAEPKCSSQQVSGGDLLNIGENPDGLSQEQLEHRERSLQTLRDIQRMLFPDEREFALKESAGQSGGPPQIPGLLEGPQKKPEGPIQAMMAQSQSLGKGSAPPLEGGMPFGHQGPRDMPFSPEDMVPQLMNAQAGDHLDHMTPEQVAWLKLQQEFYEEKRRKQEQVVVQQRSLQDMMVHQHGPRGVVRGPPPPYQMNPGDGWGPGGPDPFPDGMNMAHGLPPKGMAPHPNIPGGQMQRLPGFVGMMNPDMEGSNVPNQQSRPGLAGVNWPEEVPKMPDGRNFPPGQGVFSGPGRGERFPNPQSLQEEIFQQQMQEKQMSMAVGMGMESIRPGMEMNRGIPTQRRMEPGSNIFPRMSREGSMSPSRPEFHKGMPAQMGPGRDVEFGMGPGHKNMMVEMNMMSPNQQMISQKMRDAGMVPEEIMKMRAAVHEMHSSQQKMLSSQFDHPQQEFGMGSRSFFVMSQNPGGVIRNSREQMGPDQRTNNRLSHMPPLPLNAIGNPSNLVVAAPGQRSLGRKPSENVSAAGSQVNSPGVNPLKSPTMRQVQSPMQGSPSGNLKSPQTPSQLTGMLTGPTAAASASIKSPPVLGSAAASPVHLKSPSLPVPSPGWTSSPKPPMQSPGIPPNPHKQPLGMSSPGMMGNVESGGPIPSTGCQPASMNHPGNLQSSSNYTIPPEPTLSQNPLSIMMSRMSKFAMPSSTPLYHDAIKTVASSDDDSPPARSPNLPSLNNMPGMGGNPQNPPRQPGPHSVPMPTLSPMGMTQPLSHSNQMPSPNAMGPNMPPHGCPMGPVLMSHNQMMTHGSQDSPMVPQGRMAFQSGFPTLQSPSQQLSFPHNGPSGGQGNFPTGMGFQGEGPISRPGNHPQSSSEPVLCKPGCPGGPDSFQVMGNNMPSVYSDPELQEVIRPGVAGIPEFDLSRIIPSEKPSQTLQYFPRGEGPGRKQPHGHGPGYAHMQGMMEHNQRMGLPMPGMGGPVPVGNPELHMGATSSMSGHNPMRPGFMQQGMIGPHHRLMSPAQPGMPGQLTMMGNPGMMPGKERLPTGLYSHPGPVGSPNMLMSMQGMMGPQQNLMIPPQMRPRGMAGEIGMGGFSQGPGNPGNMMF